MSNSENKMPCLSSDVMDIHQKTLASVKLATQVLANESVFLQQANDKLCEEIKAFRAKNLRFTGAGAVIIALETLISEIRCIGVPNSQSNSRADIHFFTGLLRALKDVDEGKLAFFTEYAKVLLIEIQLAKERTTHLV